MIFYQYILMLRRFVKVCARLPIVEISCEKAKSQHVPEETQLQDSEGSSYSVRVRLRRVRGGQASALPRVYAPKFPKARLLQLLRSRIIAHLLLLQLHASSLCISSLHCVPMPSG